MRRQTLRTATSSSAWCDAPLMHAIQMAIKSFLSDASRPDHKLTRVIKPHLQ